jgi:PleD family two-component response regulator
LGKGIVEVASFAAAKPGRLAKLQRVCADAVMAQVKQSKNGDRRTQILLVDDHAVVRFGIAQLINRESDLAVCGEEEDASQAMEAIGKLKPDLVIADI